MALGVVGTFDSSTISPSASKTHRQLLRSPTSRPIVTPCKSLLSFAITVLRRCTTRVRSRPQRAPQRAELPAQPAAAADGLLIPSPYCAAVPTVRSLAP